MRVRLAASTLGFGLLAGGCWSLTTESPHVFGSARDGAASDASAVGGDGGTQQRDAGGSFCKTLGRTVALCADFDEGPLDAGFGEDEVDNGGAMALEDRPGHGRALRIEGPSGAESPVAFLIKRVPGDAAHAKVSFDLRVDSLPPNGPSTVLAGFDLQPSGGGYYRIDLWGHDEFEIAENTSIGGLAGGATAQSRIELGAWRRVELDVAFGATALATLYVEGVKQVDHVCDPPPSDAHETVLKLGMSVGPPYPTEGAALLHFDNVVLEVTPR